MTTNIERAEELIRRWMPQAPDVWDECARQAVKELDNAGLLIPDEDERLPSWVYDHPDVCTNPWRVGGVPCIRGTRIPVDIMLDWIKGASDDDEIREFYPDITVDVIDRLRTALGEHTDE